MSRLLALAFLVPFLATAPDPRGASGQTREITGSVTYLARIALPPEARMVVELRGPDERLIAQTERPTEGAQVPLAFTLDAPEGRGGTLRAALASGAEVIWVSHPVVIPAAGGSVALPELVLYRWQPMGFASRMLCGDTEVEIGFIGEGARLRIDGRYIDMVPAAAASGSRFEVAGDPTTFFWARGDRALVALDGAQLPECSLAIPAEVFPLAAEGGTPDAPWHLESDGRGLTLLSPGAPALVIGQLPEPRREGAALVFEGAGFTLRLTEETARPAPGALPRPIRVDLAHEGRLFSGAGGAPVRLLEGDWLVAALGATPLPEEVEVSLRFDLDGRLSGRGGCNRFMASFEIAQETLDIGPAAATMMACPEPMMQAERAFFDALEMIDGFDIGSEGQLVLKAGDLPAITARRAR